MITSGKKTLTNMPMPAELKKQMENLLNHPDTIELVAVSIGLYNSLISKNIQF